VFNGYWPGVYDENLVISDSGISWPNNPPGFRGVRIQLYGGYDVYCDDTPIGSYTEVNASNHSGNSVLEVSGNAYAYLLNLRMSGATGVGRGGGINFHGQGELHLTNVDVAGNKAEYGGGLIAEGNGPLSVFLHHDTMIEDNQAHTAGGGIRIDGNTRLYALEPNISIIDNIANVSSSDGAGGGLQAIGPARADLGSVNILRNSARYGGGVYVTVNDDNLDTAVRLMSTVPGQPARIDNNSASHTGGGVYLMSHGGAYGSFGQLCGTGYEINGNTAANGSAIYADSDQSVVGVEVTDGGIINLNDHAVCAPEPAASLGALPCATGSSCNAISGNTATQSDGATILVQTNGAFDVERVEMRGNRGGRLIQGIGVQDDDNPAFTQFVLSNCLLVDNVVGIDLIRSDRDNSTSQLRMSHCTIANNTIGGQDVMTFNAPLMLSDTILWQPGKTSLNQSNGEPLSSLYVMSNDIGSLGNDPTNISPADPMFANPAIGDYHLNQNSQAIDYALHAAGVDLDGKVRDIDLLPLQNRYGSVDLGAYELQTYTAPPPAACVKSDTIFCGGFETP
jgi:hypothetical protein